KAAEGENKRFEKRGDGYGYNQANLTAVKEDRLAGLNVAVYFKSRWQSWASEHTVNQKLNPFEGYGLPKEGTKNAEQDGGTRVTYVRIFDKVVGILMRTRKHTKVTFEGEMLWQSQDDGVIITLLV
uniref:Costars domain-containing protein n=1 Tax=Cyclopterus lumpus TaxID=8103 RepID=A0A8C2WCY3_CYCLU